MKYLQNITLTIIALVTILATEAIGYQFDKAKEPNYPVILPTPRNITFENGTSLIDPCFFSINTNVASP